MKKYNMKQAKAILDNYFKKTTNKDFRKYCNYIQNYLNKSYGSNNYTLNFQDLTLHLQKPDMVITCIPQNWWVECINRSNKLTLKKSRDAPNTVINYVKEAIICGNKSKTESNYQVLKDLYCLQS